MVFIWGGGIILTSIDRRLACQPPEFPDRAVTQEEAGWCWQVHGEEEMPWPVTNTPAASATSSRRPSAMSRGAGAGSALLAPPLSGGLQHWSRVHTRRPVSCNNSSLFLSAVVKFASSAQSLAVANSLLLQCVACALSAALNWLSTSVGVLTSSLSLAHTCGFVRTLFLASRRQSFRP